MVRTATLDFKPLLEAVRSIPGQEDVIIQEFENTFRSCVSAVDMHLLLTGNIPQNVIDNALISALQTAADFCLNSYSVTSNLKYRDIANMLWNPISASLFKTIAQVQVTVSSDVKKVSTSPTAVPALPKNQKKEPKSKPRDPVRLPKDQVEGIRRRLASVALTRRHLYSMTGGHPHVKCTTPNCSFCSTLFNTLNITRCEGHKRCCSAGWYPHIGVPLWNMLRAKHQSGSKNTVRAQPCKPHEIPALQDGSPVIPSSMDTIVEESAIEDTTAEEQQAYTRPTSPAFSVASQPSLSWAESVEEYYLSRKRLKRSTSVPPDTNL